MPKSITHVISFPFFVFDLHRYVSKTGMSFWEGPMTMHEGDSTGEHIGLAYCEQFFQPSGGLMPMRTREEFPLGREEPLGGVTPGANVKKMGA